MKKEIKNLGHGSYSLVVRGTPKELDDMQFLYDMDAFDHPKMRKYFYTWVSEGTGRYYFPKEKYFVSRDGDTNYAVALLHYGASNADLIYEN